MPTLRSHPPRCARAQRGAAALIVTMVLFFAMLLAAAFANRNLVFEQRTSANQYRSTQAFEAAEAGLEWAQAQLNSPARIGADCLPSADAAAPTFRERFLSRPNATSGFTGATWTNGAVVTPLQPTCVRGDAGWACSCPASGNPNLATPGGAGPHPAFTLQFMAGGKPGIVKVASRGCTSLAGACVPGATVGADATARVEVALGLLPALGTVPAAPLTARGRLDTPAALGVHNPDAAAGGLALHVGSGVTAPLIRVTPPAGSAVADAWIGNDAALAALTPERFFAAWFGLDKTGWKSQPTVKTLACTGNCTAALADAVANAGGNPMIWIGGDVVVDGPIALGTADHPVLLVVDGNMQFNGAVRLHGVLYGASMRWDNAAAGSALLRGALITEGDVTGNAAPDLFYDAALLAVLKGSAGSFARVNGSWRDF
jgi:Tfp pilus assembly protein PilX